MSQSESQNQKSNQALREEATLAFWKENNIFQKSLQKDSPKGNYVFYDGPPFATGQMHYGHILGSTAKDAIARYQTMQGAPISNWIARDGEGFTQISSANVVAEEIALAEAGRRLGGEQKPPDESVNNAMKFIGRAGCAVKCMACLQVGSCRNSIFLRQ